MTSERKYQVFISATYDDLQPERQALLSVLLSRGLIPVGMELSPGDSDSQWRTIQRLISESDYYLVLVGGRYGTLSPIGLSYTHREFVYALTKGKPILALLLENVDQLPPARREATREGEARLQDFRSALARQCLVGQWHNTRDLLDAARFGMAKLIAQYPSAGWVRGDRASASVEDDERRALRAQIDALEREKEALLQGMRPSADGLARGQEQVVLHYHCDVYASGDCKRLRHHSRLSWDQILTTVGPVLLNDTRAAPVQEVLEERLQEGALTDVQQAHPSAHAVRNLTLGRDSLYMVLLHLRALGWVRKSPGASADPGTLWQLTPLGDQQLTALMVHTRG